MSAHCPLCNGTGEQVKPAAVKTRPRGGGWKETRQAGPGEIGPTQWWRPCPNGCEGPGAVVTLRLGA